MLFQLSSRRALVESVAAGDDVSAAGVGAQVKVSDRSSTACRVAACRVAADARIVDFYNGHLLLLREILKRSDGDFYLTRLLSTLKQFAFMRLSCRQ